MNKYFSRIMNIPGERLTAFADIWEDLKASPEVVNILRHGHKIEFKSRPMLSLPTKRHETKLSPEAMKVSRREIKDLLHKGAMRIVDKSEALQIKGFYSKMFVVKKPEPGKFRVIINLKPLNKYVSKKSFKMEGINDVKNLLTPSSYWAIVDLKDAYYHVKLSNDSRKYTRFIFDDQIMEYTALPMGLTDSPRIFTRVTKFIQSFLRKQGILVVMYIDDILVIASSFSECERCVNIVLGLLRNLGFLINEKKCSLVPSQEFVYLGFVWNTVTWAVSLKPKREEKVREAAAKLLRSDFSKCRDVSVFLGTVQSTTTAVPLARGLVRKLQWEFIASCVTEADYDNLMNISDSARDELLYWANLPCGLSLPITLQSSAFTVTTDATPDGYGILFEGKLISDKIPPEFMEFSINVKELLPLDIWLNSVGDHVNDSCVTWRVDNNAALHSIKNQGSTKAWPLSCLSVNILRKALSRNITIDPVRISSEENILADCASRNIKVPDWSFSDKLVQKMFRKFGVPDVDLMATVLSRKAPLYYAWSRSDPEAWGQDSLAKDVNWKQFNLPYCFPPFPLLGQVLSKARAQGVDRMLLIAPWWPTKPWFSTLMTMTLTCMRFRFNKDMVVDMSTGQTPPDVKRCRLVGFMITGKIDQNTVLSQGQPKNLLQLPGRKEQKQLIAQHGDNGVATVQSMEYHQLPLF